MKAAIAIDTWKLPIFTRHLVGAGYEFKHAGSLVSGTLMLTVTTDDMPALAVVVKAANDEAAQERRKRQ